LGLTPHARLGKQALPEAITALVVNDAVDDVVRWLEAPPRAVELETSESWFLRDYAIPQQRLPPVDEPRARAERRSQPKPKRERQIEKTSVDAIAIQAAVGEVASDAVVPFAQSPVDITSLNQLLSGAAGLSGWIVSPRTNPFLLIEMPAGYLLLRTVQGIGQGIRRGLSDGVYYKLLQLFKVPDDWRRP
jgi:hypothetical protein